MSGGKKVREIAHTLKGLRKLYWDALKRAPITLAMPARALLLMAIVASSAAGQTLHIPPHKKYVLKNGLTVLLLEKHGVPMINLFSQSQTN